MSESRQESGAETTREDEVRRIRWVYGWPGPLTDADIAEIAELERPLRAAGYTNADIARAVRFEPDGRFVGHIIPAPPEYA